MQAQNVRFPKINGVISQMDRVQSISISCNLGLVMIERCAILIDNRCNTLVACYDSLNGIGTFNGLNLCYDAKVKVDTER